MVSFMQNHPKLGWVPTGESIFAAKVEACCLTLTGGVGLPREK